jgi:hypothetical protein
VMAHQTISVNLESRLLARLGQRLDKILLVHIRLKGISPAIGPAGSRRLSEPVRGPFRSSSHGGWPPDTQFSACATWRLIYHPRPIMSGL